MPPPVLLVDDIWVAKDAPLQPDFVATLRRSFSGGIEAIDFAQDPQAARATINAAIARTTHGRIRELVPDGTINTATKVVLTNALRLHAAWKEPFLPQATTDSPFTLADGTRIEVPTMRGELEDGYAETDAVQALSMRLAEVEIRCEIVVPKADHSIADAERALFGAGYALRAEKVDVNLPRFQVRGVHRMSPVLQALGMKAAFDPQRADFGGMTTATPLFVGDVVHEAWVKIDEQGVEAAAATAVVAHAGAKWPPDPPKVFRADRAFLFALRHAVTGLLLFVGRVDDPRRKD